MSQLKHKHRKCLVCDAKAAKSFNLKDFAALEKFAADQISNEAGVYKDCFFY